MRCSRVAGSLVVAWLLVFAGPVAGSEAVQAALVTVEHAWIRLLPAGLPNAGYAVIENHGDSRVTFTGAESPAYGSIMLHQSGGAGVKRMHVVDSLVIPAHDRVELAPGGYHLMLMQRTRSLRVGDTVSMRLNFSNGESVQAEFKVHPANSRGD